MAVLSRDEARRARARKHASYAWVCGLCSKRCRGNGGKASHKAWHVRRQGLAGEEWIDVYRRLRPTAGGAR